MPTFSRRGLLAALCALPTSVALAQGGNLNNKPLRIVVSFPPGGPVDFVARALGEQLGKELQTTVIIDNKAGANGAIGAGEVMRAPPDGSTLWITSVGAAAINPALYEKLPYDMQRDFAPVSLLVNNVELLVVHPSNPADGAAAFVAAAKRGPATLASSGIGSIPHLALEQLNDATGANFTHIPYKGAAPAITDVMGGQVSGFFGDIPGLIGHVKSGKLKALGIAAATRHPALPEVRTLAEQGIAGVDTNNWYALFAPAKTPPAQIAVLNQAVQRALSAAALRDKLLASGTEPAPSTPQALNALLKHDSEKWAKLVRDKRIKAE
jgi:tripartite-type tricarboxylate transporter receptor subunit TctC